MLVYAKEKSDLRTYGGTGQGVQIFNIEDLKEVKRKKKINLEVHMACPHDMSHLCHEAAMRSALELLSFLHAWTTHVESSFPLN